MKKEDQDLLKTAKERFKACEEFWKDIYKLAIDDHKFRNLEQWSEADKEARKGRACLVVDKLNQYVRQVVNDGRQNRPSIKVRPVDDYADEDVAEVYQGVIRHILDRSNADHAFDTSLDHAVTGGIGWFRALTEYAHEKTMDQEIVVKRIRNFVTVMIDPAFKEADGSDARFGFVVDELPKDEFEDTYPNAKRKDWESEDYGAGWSSTDNVRIVEYWYKEPTKITLHLLETGETVTAEDYARAQTEGAEAPKIITSREVDSMRVRWCKMTGAEVLERTEWAGRYIPLIPVFGNETDIEGKVSYYGLVRSAKDPQKLYNFSRSAYAERVALTPKSPYVAAVGQVEDYAEEWETANTGNHQVLRYNPQDINGTPLPPPQRQPAADVPAGFAADMQIAEHDIQASIGMYSASLGERSNEKSGRAILARQKEGDVATFHYIDNLGRSIGYLGRILVDLIPKVYDSRRVVRILGEDGSQDRAYLDPTMDAPKMEDNEGRMIYKLAAGEYDVSVATGPSYTTKRQEAAESMVQLTQANPALMGLVGDLMVRSMDWPGAEEIADRLKAMLPPQIQQMEGEDDKLPPAAQAQLQQMTQQMEQMHEALQAAEQIIQGLQGQVKQSQSEAEAAKSRAEVDNLKVQIDQFKAETDRLKVLVDAQQEPDKKAEMEALRLQYEDRWQTLRAEVDVMIAGMNKQQMPAEGTQTAQEPPKGPDTSMALAVAIEGFTQALQAMRAPRTIQFADGETATVG